MCSGIVLLLQRSVPQLDRRGWFFIHAGRLTAYSLIGALAGALGGALGVVWVRLELVRGTAALYAALFGLYLAVVLAGWLPSPELLFPGPAAAWRRIFRRAAVRGSSPGALLLAGGVWGLLPCGLVLTAAFTAAVSAHPLTGAARMAVFGLATLPVLSAAGSLFNWLRGRSWPRYGAALAVALFSLQIGMRGLAAFGVVDHFHIARVMLW